MKKVLFFVFLLVFSMSVYGVKIQGEWKLHRWSTEIKCEPTIILDFGNGDNMGNIPQFLWGCRITCGMVGTWAIEGVFLRITIMGKSSFYLIQISENEWRGVGHIFYHPAECSLYKIQ